MLATIEYEDETRIILEEEFERQNGGLEDFDNPFQSWANTIYESSKLYIKEGTGINPLYLPSSYINQMYEDASSMVGNYDTNIWIW